MPIYIRDFPHIPQPTFHKVVIILADHWRCSEAGEGGACLSVLSRLVAVTQDTRDAPRSGLIELLAALQVDTRRPLSQAGFGHFQGPTIYFGS